MLSDNTSSSFSRENQRAEHGGKWRQKMMSKEELERKQQRRTKNRKNRVKECVRVLVCV